VPTKTSAVRLEGRPVANEVLRDCADRSAALQREHSIIPHLAVVLVGDDPASAIYVRAKERACATAGIRSTVTRLAATCSTSEALTAIDALAADDSVHGIIVQLPLPAGIDATAVVSRVPPAMDADGFHLYNIGSLFLGNSLYPPCTPEGVMRLLDSAGVDLAGRHVVVVGASNIVGKPMAVMALRREATVTICHAKTRDLASHTRAADVLICAAGSPGLITADMVKPGVIVVDVGINRVEGGTVVGDVDFATVAPQASMITPVPGGVGPMTVAVLITNTVRAAKRSVGLFSPRPGDDSRPNPLARH